MFESTTKPERISASKAGLVATIAAVIFAAQVAVLAGGIAKPLANALASLPAHVVDRDELPTFTEEITVVAPRAAPGCDAARTARASHADVPVALAANAR
jgi:hypothetical protein